MPATDKPRLKLVGRDGNAYALLGAAQQAARKAKWPKERWNAVVQDATSGDYNHLLATLCKHFDVH